MSSHPPISSSAPVRVRTAATIAAAITLAGGLMGVPAVAAKSRAVTHRRAPTRSCGAKTLPARKGDSAPFVVDVDGDGANDAIVFNRRRSEARIAFAEGPEVKVALGIGWSVELLPLSNVPGGFGLRSVTIPTLSQLSDVTILAVRRGCDFSLLTRDGRQFALVGGGDRTGGYSSTVQVLRCTETGFVVSTVALRALQSTSSTSRESTLTFDGVSRFTTTGDLPVQTRTDSNFPVPSDRCTGAPTTMNLPEI